jgi:HD-GYP domain-containing protein (c-di-GMP phosphodiesterase class II)
MLNTCIRLRGVSSELKERLWESDRLLRIGRSRHLEVVLDDSSISRRHAEIALSEAGWVLRDTGSTNGTFLNGNRVGRADRRLHVHDLVQCGNLVLRVQELGEELITVNETPVGSLQVQATTEQSWEQAVELLALDMTRRQRPGEQMLSLLRAGQHLSQIASLDELLQLNARDAAVAVNAQRGCLVLTDEMTNKLVVRALFSTRPEQLMGRAYSGTLAQRCLRTGQSLLCSDVLTDPDLLRAQSVTSGEMSSVICALLRTPRRRLGVLHLDRGVSQKPFTPDDLHLADAIAAHMSTAIESAQVLQEKQRSLFIHTVLVLAQAIELRDEYTGGHTQRVTDYCLLLREELNLSSADRHAIQVGAPLHDIGKIGIDDAILRKQGPLTIAEFEQMKSHTVKGAAILGGIPDLEFIVPIVRSHHERWDGKGYPDGLAGEQIPRLARLVAVADTFDAMTTDRPYRVGRPADWAFAEIEKGIGTQFDPECASAFLRLRPRIEQQLAQNQAIVVTIKGFGNLYDVRKLVASSQPA